LRKWRTGRFGILLEKLLLERSRISRPLILFWREVLE
jgi:hypothetical protein